MGRSMCRADQGKDHLPVLQPFLINNGLEHAFRIVSKMGIPSASFGCHFDQGISVPTALEEMSALSVIFNPNTIGLYRKPKLHKVLNLVPTAVETAKFVIAAQHL